MENLSRAVFSLPNFGMWPHSAPSTCPDLEMGQCLNSATGQKVGACSGSSFQLDSHDQLDADEVLDARLETQTLVRLCWAGTIGMSHLARVFIAVAVLPLASLLHRSTLQKNGGTVIAVARTGAALPSHSIYATPAAAYGAPSKFLAKAFLFLMVAQLITTSAANGVCGESEWIDEDSRASVCTTVSSVDPTGQYNLVFSDEFEVEGRTFKDGDDPRWTALHMHPYTTEQINFYNQSLADTVGGKLRIRTTSQDVHGHFYSPDAVSPP
eukprot:SAG22_NODE_583_length_8878_cov_47.533546_7_plen_268_part_00